MIVVLGRGGRGRPAAFCEEMGEPCIRIDLAQPADGSRRLEEAEIVCGLGAHVTSEVVETAGRLKWLH